MRFENARTNATTGRITFKDLNGAFLLFSPDTTRQGEAVRYTVACTQCPSKMHHYATMPGQITLFDGANNVLPMSGDHGYLLIDKTSTESDQSVVHAFMSNDLATAFTQVSHQAELQASRSAGLDTHDACPTSSLRSILCAQGANSRLSGPVDEPAISGLESDLLAEIDSPSSAPLSDIKDYVYTGAVRVIYMASW